MGNAIEIDGLGKEYRRRGGRTVAVGGLDLSVPEGGVFGFCGPNGSGKTTTIRCLLGLVRPTRGSLRLLGSAVPDDLATTIRRVGAIVETPALFPTMTGRRNLELLGAVDRIGSRRVDEVLDVVGLRERADEAVKGYSLGMRQRLGLGSALLKDPELIILDEPANGLDPAGIAQVRSLLRRLGDEGRTVFVSSHLLSEVEATCDRVAILNKGRLVSSGTVTEVLGGDADLLVRVADLDAAVSVLARAGVAATRVEDHVRVPPGVDPDHVSCTLGSAGHWVTELRPLQRSLEERFFELTADLPAVDAAAMTEEVTS